MVGLWWGIYQTLIPMSERVVQLLPIERDSRLGSTLQFFFYDTPKVLMLLTGVVMVMGMVNSYFTPERTRALLAGRHEGVANCMAASLGIVTPFCSCSAVPLFIGFVQAGVPLGVTFSFLISAPMVNEVALTLLFAMFGWKVARLYLGMGLMIAIISGWVIGRLNMEEYLEDWVRNMPKVNTDFDTAGLTLSNRLQAGFSSVREIVGKVWPYILAGIAIGAGIHGYVPEDFMASFMGKDVWWGSASISVDWCANVYQCSRHYPYCRSIARQRRGFGYCACIHDERHCTIIARNGDFTQSTQAKIDRDFYWCSSFWHYSGWLCI